VRDHRRVFVVPHSSVTIEAATELTDVDIPTIRRWARDGSLIIEQRGDMEVVQLEEVRALALRRRASRRGALRDRLADSSGATAGEAVNIADLQGLARERAE
jgi:phage terminase Nu1 subunit (DNA packaging protein)